MFARIVAGLLLLGPALLMGQTVQESEPLRVTVTLVQVDAVVTDKAGKRVTDLTADDFEIYQDGARHKVVRSAYIPTGSAPTGERAATGPMAPARAVRSEISRTYAIVVDDFGLRYEDVPEVRRSLHKFIDETMAPGDLVAILCLGRNIGALQQFTTDKPKLHAAAENVRANPPGVRGMASGGIEIDSVNRLAYVMATLKDMPGHKSVVLITNGGIMPLTPMTPPAMTRAVDNLFDQATRSGVSIYGVDAAAEIHAAGMNASSMSFLCNSTGGKYLGGLTNDLTVSLKQAMDEQQGYYLLAYSPDPRTFEGPRGAIQFHRISVKVKRSGYKVSFNAGFLGSPDAPRRALPVANQMLAALGSPFGSPDIEAGMSSAFFDEATGPAITTLVNVKATDLTLAESGGRRVMEGEVIVMVFGDNGDARYQNALKFSGRLTEADYAVALANGFLFTLHIPMKEPGAYDVRAVVRDQASGKLGTASAFIRVPVLKKDRVALSGILLQSPPRPGDSGADLRGASALRIFHPGDALVYGYQILNPKLEKPGATPRLESRVSLYREGKLLSQGAPTPISAEPGQTRVLSGGDLKLGADITRGDYVLQIDVTDLSAGKKDREATQTIDFYVR